MRAPLIAGFLACLIATPVVAKESAPIADATTQLLLKPAEFERIEISPDGSLLAIARYSPEGSRVTLHRRDTMAVVTSIDPGKDGVITSLGWLDDGRLMVGANRLIQLYGMSANDPSLYIVRPDGQDTFKLPGNFLSTIDGDADHLLVTACVKYDDGDCITDVRRADIRRLRRLGDLVLRAPAGDTAVYADRSGNVRFAAGVEDDGNGKIWVHTAGKSEDWALINDAAVTGIEVSPLGVSRDGKTAYLQSERKDGTDAIETYDFATGDRKTVYQDAESDPISIVTSFDGRDFIGANYGATKPRTVFWNRDHPDAQVMIDLQAAFPGKRATVISADAAAALLVVLLDSDRDPGTFVLFDRKLRKVTPLAKTMSWLDPAQLGAQSEVSFTARDGLPLHGLLTLPPGKQKNLPLVVLPHGGPYGVVDTWGYDPEAQILATHGYAVLQVNFRGSGSYGRAFGLRGAMQWGRAMQDDVTDATKWAITQGVADASRICIYGASYGGYAALMGAIREPNLYRCAIGRSGVYDLAKMYKWGDIRREDYGKNYLKRVIGEDQADLASRSPAQLADQVKIPVLLAHGRLDPRVDIKHARLMKTALEKGGREVTLLEYPYTGHSLILNEYRRDFYTHLLDFLGKNLAPLPASAAGTH